MMTIDDVKALAEAELPAESILRNAVGGWSATVTVNELAGLIEKGCNRTSLQDSKWSVDIDEDYSPPRVRLIIDKQEFQLTSDYPEEPGSLEAIKEHLSKAINQLVLAAAK